MINTEKRSEKKKMISEIKYKHPEDGEEQIDFHSNSKTNKEQKLNERKVVTGSSFSSDCRNCGRILRSSKEINYCESCQRAKNKGLEEAKAEMEKELAELRCDLKLQVDQKIKAFDEATRLRNKIKKIEEVGKSAMTRLKLVEMNPEELVLKIMTLDNYKKQAMYKLDKDLKDFRSRRDKNHPDAIKEQLEGVIMGLMFAKANLEEIK